ncbi:MAG: NAD(P)-dependent oxidoreductase [Pseudobdellovibrionaceae bacterium]
MKNVLISDRLSESALLQLKAVDHLKISNSISHQPQPQELLGIHALIIRSKTQITEKLLSEAKQLQLIITCTSGFDHIDLKATNKWGITVMYTPKANVESAAELTWMMAMMMARNYPKTQEMIASGRWNKETALGFELRGKNYGIVGFGRIGQRVCEIAKAFQMNVFCCDPYQKNGVFQKYKTKHATLEKLFETCDVISVHVPKTKKTQGMVDTELFALAKQNLCLINTSRGTVIQEQDCLAAVQSGRLQYAAMDVFENEPLNPKSALGLEPKIIKTPHIGANTLDAIDRASQMAVEKLIRFFQEGATSDTLPPKDQWYFEEMNSDSP